MSGGTWGAGRLPCKRNNGSNKKINKKEERMFTMDNVCFVSPWHLLTDQFLNLQALPPLKGQDLQLETFMHGIEGNVDVGSPEGMVGRQDGAAWGHSDKTGRSGSTATSSLSAHPDQENKGDPKEERGLKPCIVGGGESRSHRREKCISKWAVLLATWRGRAGQGDNSSPSLSGPMGSKSSTWSPGYGEAWRHAEAC